MRRHFRWDKKYMYWGITAFCVIACAILFFMALNYIGLVKNALATLTRILGPFIWGLVIAYLLNPLVNLLQRRAFGPVCARIFSGSLKSTASAAAGSAPFHCSARCCRRSP